MTRFLTGNDVVDRGARREAGRSLHVRFLERVFTPEERALIREREGDDPERTVWLLWAAKETAFKVVSKLRHHREGAAPPTFEHTAFRVELVPPPAEPGSEAAADFTGPGAVRPGALPVAGRVLWRDARVAFRGEAGQELVHVVGWAPADEGDPAPDPHLSPPGLTAAVSELEEEEPGGGGAAALRHRFSAREWQAVHGRASARVRLRARAAAAGRLGVDEGELALLCPGGSTGRTPPHLLLRGEPAPLDVSLSHHGRFLAWSLVD